MTRMEWTDDVREWFVGFVPGHTEREISDECERLFGVRLTEGQIGNAKTRFGVRSGTHGGRFEKGHVPANKGVPLSARGLSGEKLGRMAAHRFEKGNRPANAKPIGSERLSKEGYVEVKVADGRGNANYRFKHLLVYEEHHGAVPEGCRVVFADRDRTNLDPSNLVAVPRRLAPRINSMSDSWRDADTLRAVAAVAELQCAAAAAERSIERECRDCGAAFRPEFGSQSRCRACIDARKAGR